MVEWFVVTDVCLVPFVLPDGQPLLVRGGRTFEGVPVEIGEENNCGGPKDEE